MNKTRKGQEEPTWKPISDIAGYTDAYENMRDSNLLCLIGTSNFQGTYRLNTYTPIIIIAKSSDNAEVSKTITCRIKMRRDLKQQNIARYAIQDNAAYRYPCQQPIMPQSH